ncbi:hypothetical protein [Halogeometricum sp. CBA1124]|uniref:hypothetical protein n=1 Tax=Halogeometricum sp. CBA1124 TaxID=2668071 RepID=UPI0014297A07|nr:hypothetical protein [Halogeometricum sp. CBA1124]MUV56072.1 hypothetical protein [Halogeometricum sp. CBA1124]
METYQTRSQSALGVSHEEWHELVSFLDQNTEIFERSRDAYGIEERVPEITYKYGTQVFSPKGWVGRYPGDIMVVPGKLSQNEYEQLITDVAGWLEMWSVPTAAAIMPLVARESNEPQAMTLGYSRAVIELTESVLSHRPHVEVTRRPTRGPAMQGRLLVEQTVSEWGSGNKELVTERTEFSVETLPNLLIIRFHLALANALDELAIVNTSIRRGIDEYRHYHLQFIEDGLPGDLLDQAISTDFTDSTVLSNTREAATGTLNELVDLWEAYQSHTTLSVSFGEQLSIGIKPVSKMYEVWVLQILLDEIASILDMAPSTPDDNLNKFEFTSDVTLHYDRPLTEYSHHLDELVENPGRPDYALSVDDAVTWIGDAKFRPLRNIELADYQRLFGYSGDLLPATGEHCVSILYPGNTIDSTLSKGGHFNVNHLPIRPSKITEQRQEINARLSHALATENHEET